MRIIFTFIFAFFFIVGIGFSQGTETFENICTTGCSPATSSYSTRTWNGQDGSIWTATLSRTDQTINNEAITMNDDVSGASIESGSIAGGVKNLSLTTQRKFSGGNSFVDVLINGVSIGTAPVGTAAQTTTFEDLDIAGNIVIRINNDIGGSNGGGQDRVAVDDITWTGFVLPVELAEFKIQKNIAGANELSWNTLSEINNNYFEIQRASNGNNFQSIGMVEGNGNSTKEEKYSFIDPNPSIGMNYYKLKQVDLDGKFEFSNTIRIENKSEKVKIYPTNVISSVNIQIADTELANLTIINSAGENIKNVALNSTFNTVDLSELVSGVYFAKVESKTQSYIQRIIKI